MQSEHRHGGMMLAVVTAMMLIPEMYAAPSATNRGGATDPQHTASTNGTLRGDTASAAFTLRGVVVQDNGEPLVGASIREKGAAKSVPSDVDGSFSLHVSGQKPVVVSFIGVEDMEFFPTPETDTLRMCMTRSLTFPDMDLGRETPQETFEAFEAMFEPQSHTRKRHRRRDRHHCHGDVWFMKEIPEFADGGLSGLERYFRNHLRHLEADMGREGAVKVKFTLYEDGSIHDAHILESNLPEAYGTEVLRITDSMPHWKPGIDLYDPVKVKCTMRIIFRGTPTTKHYMP